MSAEYLSMRSDKGNQLTMRDLSILLTDAFREDMDPDTPVFANVKMSVTAPAPLVYISIGKESNG